MYLMSRHTDILRRKMWLSEGELADADEKIFVFNQTILIDTHI